jgi:hypothetical protein
MQRQIVGKWLIFSTLAASANAQTLQRQATIVGGGNADRGKCTVEVLVDDVAQIEIRGAMATMRNMSGQPAQLRRFECTGPLPANPANFRFEGVDGRGRQSLVRDPRNGGVAIVQIEDREGGAEGYTFDLVWDSRGSTSGDSRGYNNGNGQYDRGPGPLAGNAPGYRDQADGPIYREGDRYRDRSDEQYRPNYRDSDYYRRYNHGFAVDEAVRVCQQEVQRQAVGRFRVNDIHFYKTRIDDNPGRQDWVAGTLDVHRGPRTETYNFSCSVDFDSGRVRSAQLESRAGRSDGR